MMHLEIGDASAPANRLATVLAEGLGPDHPALADLAAVVLDSAELQRLRAEVEALRADAGRYRWMKSRYRCMSVQMDGQHEWVLRGATMHRLQGPTFDAAIDAAIAKVEGGGNG
jgi:hypothetical protein